MSTGEFVVWKKEYIKKYDVDIVFINKNLELVVQDDETDEKVKGFSATSFKDSLVVMLHTGIKYRGYFYGTYISSNLLDINKIIGHLEDSKIKQLDVYLE